MAAPLPGLTRRLVAAGHMGLPAALGAAETAQREGVRWRTASPPLPGQRPWRAPRP